MERALLPACLQRYEANGLIRNLNQDLRPMDSLFFRQ